MKLLQNDFIRLSLVTTILLVSIFLIVDRLLVKQVGITSKLQVQNEKLNRKLADTLVIHRRAQLIIKSRQLAHKVACVEEFVAKSADNLQAADIKLIASSLVKNAYENNVPIPLAIGMVKAVSNFNYTKIGPLNRRGIMQMTVVAAGTSDLEAYRKAHEIEEGLTNGMSLLGEMVRKYNTDIALLVTPWRNRSGDNVAEMILDVSNTVAKYSMFEHKRMEKWYTGIDGDRIIKMATAELKAEAEKGSS